jgi:peptidoglycan/xylan/chitin deacetylase (PgdA/CDA1 family)/peroxiredoxin
MLKWACKRAGIGREESYSIQYFRGIRFKGNMADGGRMPAKGKIPRGSYERYDEPLALLTTGMEVPDFSLPTMDGRRVAVSDFRGSIMLLNFWAFWCDTWKEEVIKFESLRSEHPGLDFKIVAVSIDGLRKEKGEDAVRAGKIDFPVLLDYEGAICHSMLGIREVPTLFLVDERGTVRFTHRGYPGDQILAGEIRAIMNGDCREEPGEIAFSFDDFPNQRTSSKLLDLLSELGIKATFFATGRQAEKYPELVRRALREGHEIGNHSYAHLPCTGRKAIEILDDFRHAQEVLGKILGAAPSLARAPGGARTGEVLNAFSTLHLKNVPWDIESGDLARPGAVKIAEKVLSRAGANRVVLFHDGVEDDWRALPFIVKELRRRGCVFVTAGRIHHRAGKLNSDV